MILFVGQIERGMREREAFQELDYRAVFGTMTKWATEIDDAARIPEIISRAFHVATAGRPGPVVIALPEDVLTDLADVPMRSPIRSPRRIPRLLQTIDLQKRLWAAKKPVAILGGSRWDPQAIERFQRFAERFDLPVAVSFRRQMLFPADHP
jgi:acetolactate synthase-1/2/3 large subunit